MKSPNPIFFDKPYKVFFVLLLPALLVYVKSVKFGFTTMDEQWMIVKDFAFLEKWSSIKRAFLTPSTEIYYRPLFLVSLIIDYHLGKLSPGIYHFTNLVWHLISVVLLYRFLVVCDVPKKNAFIFTLLFSVHPVLLHAVAWVPGRNDIMLAAFTLASLIQLKKYMDAGLKKYFFLNLLFLCCALFTKESAILLPLVFIAFYLTFQKFEFKKTLPVILAWIVITFLWLLLWNSIAGNGIRSNNDLGTNLLNFILGSLLFIGKTVFPFQQSVMPTLSNTSVVPGILTLGLLIFLCFTPGLKNKKVAFLGLLIFAVLLAIPVWFGASKIGSEHYEQRIYGSMAGLMLFFTQLKFNTDSKSYLWAVGIFLAVFLIKTNTRIDIYKNQVSFMDAGIKECPDYYLFYLQKADMLNDKGDFNASIPYYDKTIAIRPNYPQSLSNRGSAYFSTGRFKEAIDDYNKAIANSEFNKLYYLNRCQAYYRYGNIESAMKDLVIIKKCCQDIVKADLEKNIIDKWTVHVEGIKKQLSTDPQNPALYYKIATLYFDIEMKEGGLKYLNHAILLDPANEEYKQLQLKQKS